MNGGLDFAFFGSSLVSAYWNGAATYYRGIARALAARGHRVTFYEPDAYNRQQHRDIADPEWARVVVYPATASAAEACVEEAAASADILIKCSGVGVFDALLEAAVLEARRPDTVVLFWDVDAPATLDRIEGDITDPFRALIPRYDAVLTYGGGDPVVSAYTRLGAQKCVPVYNALDPATHFPAPPESRYDGILGFLGNRLPDREARVDEFFLRAAELLPKESFVLGGNGWGSRQLPANVRWVGHVYTRHHNGFNSTARAVLNVNRASMAKYGFSPPTRIFEAAGAAACVITDVWPGIELFLEPGREVLVAEDGAEVAALVHALTPGAARACGDAARAHILAEHTYTDRAAQVEQLLARLGSRPLARVNA